MAAMQASSDQAPSQLIDQVRAASAARQPLRIVGGDTKAFYGDPTRGERLSTASWRGITSHEPTELVVTVRAGTPLAELEAALADKGQCLPFEPPRFGPDATVGGMVAAGLAGPARASAGGVRDYVLGLQFIDGRGEWLTFGGQVMKNVAGYDVSRVMAGSLGTLGVITDVSLKVLPVAPAEATLVFAMNQHDALEQLHRWGGQPLADQRQLLGERHDPGRCARAAVRALARRGRRGGGRRRAHAARGRGPARGQCPGRGRLGRLPRPDTPVFQSATLAAVVPVADVVAANGARADPAIPAAGRMAGCAALAVGASHRRFGDPVGRCAGPWPRDDVSRRCRWRAGRAEF